MQYQQSSESHDGSAISANRPTGLLANTPTIWPGSLGDIKNFRPRLGEIPDATKVWRAPFGDAEAWRRQGNDDLDRLEAAVAAGKIALERANSSQTHSSLPLAQLSVLDQYKLIEQCDIEEAQIHSEFAMLERADFVDFIQNNPQPSIKAPDAVFQPDDSQNNS